MRAPKIHRALIVGVSALVVIVAVMLGVGLLSSNNGGESQGLGKVKCDVGGTPVVFIGRDDPIKVHNLPVGSAEHEHVFFGSTVIRTTENPNTLSGADLVGQPTLCRDPGDGSLYWMPTFHLLSTGAPVQIQQGTFYYRCPSGKNQNCPTVVLPPDDLRLIASRYNYTCGEKSGSRSAPVLTFPDCQGLSGKPGLTFTVHITFPSYWDGKLADHTVDGDTQDSAHFAYPAKGGGPPPGFPIGIPQLKETFQVAYTGDPADLVLSSDEPEGQTLGRSMHADWLDGWGNPALQVLIDQCIKPVKPALAKVCDR